MSAKNAWLVVSLAISAMAGGGCAGTGTGSPRMAPSLADGAEARAILLLLEDRDTFDGDGIALAALAAERDDALRARLALTLGRLADRRGAGIAERLAGDQVARVRAHAVFALGEIAETGEAAPRPAILLALLDEDREVGRLAVEAAAKAKIPLEEVVAKLIEGPSQEMLPRLLPTLYRFDSDAVIRWAELGLEEKDATARAQAIYALGRNPRPAALGRLRQLVATPDPWSRSVVARGLGRAGTAEDLPALRALLDDPAPGPAMQALRAFQRLRTDGKLAGLDVAEAAAWRAKVLALLADPRAGVRLTTLELALAFLPDPALFEKLAELTSSPVARERELALDALAEGGSGLAGSATAAPAAARRLGDDPEPPVRAAAARAAAFLRDDESLIELAADASPAVRRQALELRLAAAAKGQGLPLAIKALEDRDFSVRAGALDWLKEQENAPLEPIAQALIASTADLEVDAQVAAIQAMAAIAARDDESRDRIVTLLEPIAKKGTHLVRRAAIEALRGLGEDPPEVGAATTNQVDAYRALALASPARRFVVETEKGPFTLELDPENAPRTCRNFAQLASQGFYDGLTFHRIVPDFVVQTGDPRGDGVGGPGYTLRDEFNLRRFDAFTLGMAHAGPDTAGSQWFVTLTPQPHLDGNFTQFGHVVAGRDVLEKLVQGDRILTIRAAP